MKCMHFIQNKINKMNWENRQVNFHFMLILIKLKETRDCISPKNKEKKNVFCTFYIGLYMSYILNWEFHQPLCLEGKKNNFIPC